MNNRIIRTLHSVVNPSENSGESLIVKTTIFSNGDPGAGGLYYNQKITLNSYGNSASFELSSDCLTPEVLRRLANEIEIERAKAVAVLEMEKEYSSDPKRN